MQGRMVIWIIIAVIAVGLIAWYAGLFGGKEMPASDAPATTEAPATTSEG
ncbi:hypothetical protein [Frigidibacter sp. ROC022]|nr:hypothetical protein [Frigidibacter sp. ROC022]MCR8725677.1 hypothetical protein [Frigidibacter sp. ROC022]